MKKIKRIVLSCVLVLIIGLALVFLAKPHFLYILGEHIGVNCKKIEMNTVFPDNIKKFSLSELNADAKVSFNQSLMLINADYQLQNDFIPSLSAYKDTDVKINECLQEAYGKLSQAVNEATGSKLFVSSAYRTKEEQQELYKEDPSTANPPDASEHQSGLGLDVYVRYYAGFGFIKTDAGQFVNSKCWEYGFIIRYPSYGKSKTGMKYEPWHIRYVGEPHAEIIYNNHLTLEEYIQSLSCGDWYEVDGYLISRQKLDDNGMLSLPCEFSNAVISFDNTGSYIITIANIDSELK